MSLLEEYVAEGIEKGWDVSWFFKEEWDDNQLWQIMTGLSENTPLELWAKKEYNWEQMHDRRWGVKKGLYVSQYLDPNLSADEVEKIYDRLLKEKKNEAT